MNDKEKFPIFKPDNPRILKKGLYPRNHPKSNPKRISSIGVDSTEKPYIAKKDYSFIYSWFTSWIRRLVKRMIGRKRL